MCIIVNGYRVTAFRVSKPKSVRFLFVDLDEERSLQKRGGYTRRIAGSLAVWMLLPAQREAVVDSDEQHAILTKELQSALRLTVGFWDSH